MIQRHIRRQPWLAFAFLSFVAGMLSLPTFSQGNGDVSPPSSEMQQGVVHDRLAEIRRRLSALPVDAAAVQSAGATDAEWGEYKRTLRLLAQLYQTHLDSLNRLESIRRYHRETAEKTLAWHGFELPGPYAADFIDNLWNAVLAKEREVEALRKEQALFDRTLEDARLDLKRTEQGVRKADERLEGSAVDEKERANWLRSLSDLRRQQEEARLAMLDTERDFHNELLSVRISEQTLLKRQALTASRISPLTPADLDAKLALLDRKQQEIEAATQKAIEADRESQARFDAVRERLEKMQEHGKPANPQEEQARNHEIVKNRVELDASKLETEAAAAILKIMRMQALLLAMRRELWEHRYASVHQQASKEAETAMSAYQRIRDIVDSWLDFLGAELEIIRRRVDDQQQHVDAWKQEYGDRAPAMREQAALVRWESMLRGALAEAEDLDGDLRSWSESMFRPKESISFAERLKNLQLTIYKLSVEAWNFEIVAVEDKIMVEGREIVGKRSVTLGKIMQALAILVIGLWCSTRIGNWWRGRIMQRFSGKESSALLIHRIFSMATAVLLVVFSLLAVNIPLTVFAFVGGALAIGLGFGAQNILNNFISGLILLVESPIRLNDIVEVDGVRGRVNDIGARCCQIRCFDGIDMLIPNSTLLEKNVTNWTLSDHHMRFTISVDAAYGSPIHDVMSVLKRAVEEHPRTLDDPAPEIYLQEFGDSSLLFRADYWVDISKVPNWMRVASDLRIRLEELFDEIGVVISFPQRDIHLDSVKPLKIELVGASLHA
ncbi:mechanosensitive ion channel [Candidatus Methylospira mobilis]|uniref:Mechanosensitive ion channel n=1 Tax=Candidatus Methylospira mobilis TaxID=1808979 RepID=A0A5Q0BN44_9GAMM|nr:mechanosensitive ion channel domain-containing protein [Candidatus Methylospira mobilis]QFY43538.1 mechanosensitive ion channel [Candidatus Methylospira mobilis]